MQNVNSKYSLASVAAACLTLLAMDASAATGRVSEVRAAVMSGNSWTSPDEGDAWLKYVYNSTTPLTLSNSQAFYATDSQGAVQVTNFSYTGSSLAEFGALHVSAAVTVDNPQLRGERPNYLEWNGNRYTVQPGGVPDGYGLRSWASVSDTLQTGRSDVASLQIQLLIDGTLSGQTPAQRTPFMPYAGVQVDQRDNGAWSNVFYQASQPSYDLSSDTWAMGNTTVDATFWSNSFTVTGGLAHVSLELWAYAEISDLAGFGMTGGSFSAETDFSHTVRIVGVRAFDAQGIQVAVGSLTGESGFVYAGVSPVPEPATWALMLGGLGALIAFARRRSDGRR